MFLFFIENISLCYLTECLCQSHLATQLINRTYSMSVEHLFDRIFGKNDFIIAYRTSRRVKGFSSNSRFFLLFLNRFLSIDYHANEWQVNNETGKRERLCTYKVSVAAVFGSTTICSNERQVKGNCRNYFSINRLFRLSIVNYQNRIISSIQKFEMME